MYNMMPLGLVLKMAIGSNRNLFIEDDKNFIHTVNAEKKI